MNGGHTEVTGSVPYSMSPATAFKPMRSLWRERGGAATEPCGSPWRSNSSQAMLTACSVAGASFPLILCRLFLYSMYSKAKENLLEEENHDSHSSHSYFL